MFGSLLSTPVKSQTQLKMKKKSHIQSKGSNFLKAAAKQRIF